MFVLFLLKNTVRSVTSLSWSVLQMRFHRLQQNWLSGRKCHIQQLWPKGMSLFASGSNTVIASKWLRRRGASFYEGFFQILNQAMLQFFKPKRGCRCVLRSRAGWMWGKKEIEIWPLRPRCFAATIAMHYTVGVACQWGVHIGGRGGGVDIGPYLVDSEWGEVASMGGGGVNQRSRQAWTTVCSNWRLFQRQRSKKLGRRWLMMFWRGLSQSVVLTSVIFYAKPQNVSVPWNQPSLDFLQNHSLNGFNDRSLTLFQDDFSQVWLLWINKRKKIKLLCQVLNLFLCVRTSWLALLSCQRCVFLHSWHEKSKRRCLVL